jgi:hypothetical protein
MKTEKTTSIFRTEKDKKEFVRLFRKMTMSGVINEDVAVEKLIRDNPHFFRVPSENEVKRTFNDVLNSEIRSRARQTNKFTDSFFTKGK